jgi:hypothetical protein
MGLRFHRSIKLVPGVRLNAGKRGISTSIAARGADLTFGKSGTRTTVGLPGSGYSYTHFDKPHQRRSVSPIRQLHPEIPPDGAWRGLLWTALIVVGVLAALLVHLAQS